MVTATGADTATSASDFEHTHHSSFPCNACSVRFDDTKAQRHHMQEPWHIYNIKRRMVSLPPISAEIFFSQIEAFEAAIPSDAFPSEDDDESSFDDPDDFVGPIEPFLPSTCIFCATDFSDVSANLAHMASAHNLHIPDIDYLIDLETFISYLGTLVQSYHECLYCGHVKHSAQGTRQHMLAKGHCMINLDSDSEFLDFWEFPDSDDASDSSDDAEASKTSAGRTQVDTSSKTRLSLSSGTVITPRTDNTSPAARSSIRHRSFVRRAKKQAISDTAAAAGDSSDSSSDNQDSRNTNPHEQRIAVRGELGMQGVSEQQRRALRAVEKKIISREIVAKAKHTWSINRFANHQKHFRMDVPGRPNGVA